MSVKSVVWVASVALIGFAGSASATTNLVTNGGFESTTPAGSTNFFIGYAGFPQLADWTYTPEPSPNDAIYTFAGANSFPGANQGAGLSFPLYGPGTGFPNGFVASPNGGNFLAADAEMPQTAPISQTISGLTVGEHYALSFEYAGNQFLDGTSLPYTGPLTISWQASLGAQSFSTPVATYAAHSFTGWMTQTFTYTATSSSEVLSFLASGTPNGLPPTALLDGISLTVVPEPSTWAMLVLGFGGLGFAAYRPSRKNASALASA
jgi:hypothetical protein